MTEHIDQVAIPENGLAEGLGSENTQPGPAIVHAVELDSLDYGLGSAETQGDVTDPDHVTVDHSEDGAEKGLPLGLGSDNTQDGPPVAHPAEPESMEFGMGSADSQHEAQPTS